MARKYELISELYDRTCKTVVSNPQSWQKFLESACRNYKLRFDEQLLIFAQRPDATAVLEIERWNTSFGRWVNKGAKGIAVFEDADRSRQRLTHYFDISDTHESRYSRPVPLWNMRDEYDASVIETFESTFGELENKSSLSNAVMSAAQNAAEDNLPDYLNDLVYISEDSFLEELSEDMIASLYKKVVTNSVAYMMMSRLGINAEEYFEADDFRDVTNFNTQDTLNALGIATSDIAEMGLSEISKTVMALDRENRIIDEQRQFDYNKDNKDERSQNDERNHIHDGGRLQSSEPDSARTVGSDSRQMVEDEENLSERTSQNPVLQSFDERDAYSALGGSSAESDRVGGNLGQTDGTERGTDGADESERYDEMGSLDEQHQEFSTGNREGTGNLRLEYYDRRHEDKSLPFFGNDDTIREILGTTPHLKASKEEIKDFFELNTDSESRTEYIKSIFNNDYTELTLKDGRTVGYKTFQNVLHLWEGSYNNRTAQSYYDWGVIAQHFEAMRLLGELSDEIKPLPSTDSQLSLIESSQAEEKKTSAFTFSQEVIDAVLTRGSGVSEGKMRIYEQFEKSLSAKENADFLKNEYGWGGSYPVIIGAGIDENHDGKGITLSKGFGNGTPKLTLKWNQVEKRIGELIRMDRYLNPKEKEQYPKWLEKQEERRAELAEQQRNREILSSAPPETENNDVETEARYEYHLGDTVYIGASEYEILSFDDERVMLYDTEMPLFNKEFERSEFDRKVRENPMNEHLRVTVLPAAEKADTGENIAQNDTETEQKTDYEDAFFINREQESVTWMYFNPDSNAGGQYVTNELSFDEIREAAQSHKSADDFFDYLGSIANQTLADVGTEWFEEADNAFKQTPDLTGCTSATMEALLENAERSDMVATNIGKVPIEDYREIVAVQNGFDSYDEMYNEGIRIGNGYLSFKEQDISPELAQKIGMEFVNEVWGKRFQAVVTTHLNTKHLHCHYVINSVSFVDGKRLWGDEKAWFKFRLVADKICEKYGLYYNPNPNRSKQSSYYYKQEQAGMPTRYSMTRQVIDEAIAHSTNLKSLDYALTQMGYEHCLSESRKYWSIVPKGYKKPIRLKNLGEDYTEEAIKRRLTENQGVRLMPFTNQTVVIRQYRLPTREHKIKKVGGLYGLYLHYCYKLGYLPKYKKQNTARLHYLLKEDLLKLDKITQETRLLGRENISTDEQLFSYKESVLSQIKTLTDDRTHLRKQLRKNLSDDELSKVKEQISTITGKLWTLRKEVGLCDDIAERSKVIEANLETVRAYEEKQERKEQNRNDKFR